MSYRRYQRRRRPNKSIGSSYSTYKGAKASSKVIPLLIFCISVALGVGIFFLLKTFFFESTSQEVRPLLKNGSGSYAEVMLQQTDRWSHYDNDLRVSAGDSIRSIRGNNSVLEFETGTEIFFPRGTEFVLKKSETDKEGNLTAEISIVDGLVWVSAKRKNPNDMVKVWVSESQYVLVTEEEVLISKEKVQLLSQGERQVFIVLLDENKKVIAEKPLRVGQEYHFEKEIISPLDPEIYTLNFYKARKGEPVDVQEPVDNTEPIEIDPSQPQITFPEYTNEPILVTASRQEISGEAPENTNKIFVQYANEEKYPLSRFTQGDKSWKYIASIHNANLKEGKNVYKVYAEDENGNLSKPVELILEYRPDQEDDQPQSALVITNPNGGRSGAIKENVIVLEGSAPSSAAYIVIENDKLGISYQLKQFKKGDKTWKYTSGKMDAGTYSYRVKALSEQKRFLSSAQITLTVGPVSANSTPTPTPTPSPNTNPVESSSSAVSRSTTEVSR